MRWRTADPLLLIAEEVISQVVDEVSATVEKRKE